MNQDNNMNDMDIPLAFSYIPFSNKAIISQTRTKN